MLITSNSVNHTRIRYNNPYLDHKLDNSKPEIRVLHLLPGQKDEEIKGHCRVVNLDDRPAYNALSYVWGNERDKTDILVEGTRVKVTVNLADALKRIRLRHGPLLIWADAVCINQEDPVEKAHQISLMQRIYSQCTKVMVWMGHIIIKSESGDAAIVAARAAANALHFCADDHLDTTIEWPGPNPVAVSASGEAITAGDALQALMDCAWWQRIWTVQEIVKPRNATVFWGPLQIPFMTIAKATNYMMKPRRGREPNIFDLFQAGTALFAAGHTAPFTIPVLSVLHAKRWNEDRIPLLYRLWRFHDRKATDAKDKLFGMWALLEEESLPSIQSSDYSLDAATLFTRVMVDLLTRANGSLQSLIGWRDGRMTAGLPSWVLDLVHPDSDDCAGDYFWTHEIAWRTFYASRGLPPYLPRFPREPGEMPNLELKGVLVDDVACIVVDMRYGESLEWELSLERLIEHHPRRERLLSQFHNVIGGRLDESHERVSDVGWLDNTWWLERMLRFQVLFLTRDGRIGVGPTNLKSGDKVWIFSGGNHPFLLRPRPLGAGNSQKWEFVGDCFVYGIMYGEATSANKSVLDAQYAILC